MQTGSCLQIFFAPRRKKSDNDDGAEETKLLPFTEGSSDLALRIRIP